MRSDDLHQTAHFFTPGLKILPQGNPSFLEKGKLGINAPQRPDRPLTPHPQGLLMSLDLSSLKNAVLSLESALGVSSPDRLALLDRETGEVIKAGVIQNLNSPTS